MCAGIHNDLAHDTHVDLSTTLFEFPGVNSAKGWIAYVDACVIHQILWFLRHAVACEIRRRCHRSHSYFRSDRRGDHIFIDGVAESDARIEAISNDVPEAIVDIKLNLDVRVFEEQRRESRKENCLQDKITASNAHRARRLVTKFGQSIQFSLDLVKTMTNGLHQAFPRVRRRNAASGTRQ